VCVWQEGWMVLTYDSQLKHIASIFQRRGIRQPSRTPRKCSP